MSLQSSALDRQPPAAQLPGLVQLAPLWEQQPRPVRFAKPRLERLPTQLSKQKRPIYFLCQFDGPRLGIHKFFSPYASRGKPCPQSLRLSGRPLTERNYGLVRRMQTQIGECHHRGQDLAFVLAVDTNNVTVALVPHDLENVGASRQSLRESSRNFDGPAEGNNCFPELSLKLC